ncbi:hypothetical protein ZWY2020_005075 [Hordeum vulgare]|nr:hypothetical protein ZWY2020_005075 [Hordeum vulgare]
MRSRGDPRATGLRMGQEVAISPLDEVLAAAAAANHGQQAPKIPRDAVQCTLQLQLHANAAIEEARFHVSEESLDGNQFGVSNIPGAKDILFGPGVQLQSDPAAQEARARSALLEANLSGKGLLSAVTNSVSGLQLDEHQQFQSQLFAAMPPSVLGAPPSSAAKVTTATTIKKKVMAPFGRRIAANAALRPSMTSMRRTQARICKAMGLISSEDQFTDATLQDYLAFFKDPMS